MECLIKGKRFFCREWAFAKIGHCLDTRPTSRTSGALVTGGPGSGKTALCSEIVWPTTNHAKQRNLRKRLLAYHFCQNQEVRSLCLTNFILSMVHQLKNSEILPGYREIVESSPDIQAALNPRECDRDPDEAFRKAILYPLIELKPPNKCSFVLVDNVDSTLDPSRFIEGSRRFSSYGGPGGSRNIAELLANHHHLFPQWLLLVCSARRHSRIVTKLFTGFRKITLDDQRKAHVIKDAQQYILSRLQQDEAVRAHLSRETAEMLNQLHIKSNGCFLYLEKVLDGVGENFINLREIRDIPGTLNGLYLWLSQRLFTRKQFQKILPLVNTVLASLHPLSVDELRDCIRTKFPAIEEEDMRRRLTLLNKICHKPVTEVSQSVAAVGSKRKSQPVEKEDPLKKLVEPPAEVAEDVEPGVPEAKEEAAVVGEAVSDICQKIEENYIAAVKGEETVPVDGEASCVVEPSAEPAIEEPVKSLMDELNEVGESPGEEGVEEKFEAGTASNKDESSVSCPEEKPCEEADVQEPDVVAPVTETARIEEGVQKPVTVSDTTVILFHYSFAEWLKDVKHCTQKYLCNPGEGHAILSLYLTARGPQLCDEDVHELAYHLLRMQTPSTWKYHHTVLWLMLSDIPVENSLADLLPRDEMVLKLLRDAGAKNFDDLEDEEDVLDEGDIEDHVADDEDVDETAPTTTGCDVSIRDDLEVPSEEVPLISSGSRLSLNVENGHKRSRRRSMDPSEKYRDPIEDLLTSSASDLNRADAHGKTILHTASHEGNVRVVEALIGRGGVDLEPVDREGQTPLNLAARQGHEGVVEALLRAGVNPDHADGEGWTALRSASWGGHYEVVESLLRWGARVDYADADRRTALRAAAWGGHDEVVQLLVEAGAEVNRADNEGRTALIAAAYMGHAEIVEYLLDNQADINHEDDDGRTALSVAALCVPANEGYTKVVQTLLNRRAKVDHQDRDGMTPLLVAAFEGHREVCELLLRYRADVDHADKNQRTALWAAASMGHADVVELLLNWDCYVDSIDGEGRTVLSVAAAQGSEEVVRLLLDRGLDEMHRDNSGWAPLHYAAFEGHAEVSQMLITAGAKVNEVDTEGRHALILAAQEGHVGVVSVLIRNGARLSLRGHDGRNVLRVAALQGHRDVVQFLLCHQAKINYRDPDGRTTLYILALENKLAMAKFFLDHRAQVDLSDTEGRSPLHVASWQGHSQMCDLLMNYGANPNAVDNDNRTPLQSASWQGNADVVHLLLSRGASANHMCNQGATALCIAAQEGHLECVRVLLKYGANPNHLDACGRSPIRVAFKGGHHSVVQLLESVTSNKISTMDSPSGSSLISRGVSTSLGMEDASPGSTCDKRRSFISIGNNSSSGKSSSNISSTTHSRGSGGGGVVGQTPSYPAVVSSMGSGSMSFTQQLQQATRFRNRLPPPGGCPQSRFPLSPHDEDPESPVYATPPISPESDGGFVGGPGDVTTPMSSHHPLGGALRTAPPLPHQPPSHFAKNEHMRIILGCTGIHNGHQSSSSSSSDKSSSKRPCNGHAKGNSNGIFNGNGALEKPNPGRLPRESGGGGIGEGIRNFLKGGVAGRLKRPFLKSHSTTTSSSPNAVTDGGQTDVDQMLEILRKETPL